MINIYKKKVSFVTATQYNKNKLNFDRERHNTGRESLRDILDEVMLEIR